MNRLADDIIRNRRSTRRFAQRPVPATVLEKGIDCARLAPSAANLQPLEYVVVDDPQLCAQLFESLAWAGYVRPRRNPPPGKRPVAYVVVLINTAISTNAERDVGAAVENLLLGVAGDGVASCWIRSIDEPAIRELLGVPSRLEIDSVIALGYPGEQLVVEEAADDIKYWLDEDDVLHVPKRRLDDVLHRNWYGASDED